MAVVTTEEILKGLLEIDTTNPPGNETTAALWLKNVLQPLGFTITVQEVAPGRSNLIAVLEGAQPGETLALSGHLDVVAADKSQWNSPPFTLEKREGRFYGRGTSDMKGGIAAMVAAACAFASNKDEMKGRLALVFVADEELFGTGSAAYVQQSVKPDMVVIGEPTSMEVCIAHRGATRYMLDFIGKSGHAGLPQKAHNPIYDAARFCLEAEKQNSLLDAKQHPVLPPPSIAVTILHAGEQSNSIPGVCKLTVDRRTLPEENRTLILSEIEEILERAKVTTAAKPEFIVEMPGGEPVENAKIGKICQGVLEKMGRTARLRDFEACCDQHFFTTAGIDCVLVGPGNLAQAHTANEFIEAEELETARIFYQELIQKVLY